MADVTVTVSRRGPLLVQGASSIELVDARGNSFPVEKDSIALCRCGASDNKPFCDGSHRACGFDDETSAA
jgi:CDGSH-type Zn-finger protein